MRQGIQAQSARLWRCTDLFLSPTAQEQGSSYLMACAAPRRRRISRLAQHGHHGVRSPDLQHTGAPSSGCSTMGSHIKQRQPVRKQCAHPAAYVNVRHTEHGQSVVWIDKWQGNQVSVFAWAPQARGPPRSSQRQRQRGAWREVSCSAN